MSFGIRGVIEGFYDRLWTWEERTAIAEFVAERGFNAYAWAPKEDRLQNAGWRTRYPDAERSRLRAFGERCGAAGMAMWAGLRPVGISYADDADARLAADKLRDYLELGADGLVLLADDIPSQLDVRAGGRFDSLAAAHLWLIEGILDALALPPQRLVFVPTDYAGPGSPYLETLAAGLPAGVEVCWTGPDVCSATISAEDASAIGRLLGRPALVWDNYPVNDAAMTRELHLGPIRGRDVGLGAHVSGILANPALQPEATRIPLATWAEYLRDPDAYDPDAAWQRALDSVAGAGAPAVAVVAAALDRSVIDQGWEPPSRGSLVGAVAALDQMENRRLAADLEPFIAPLRAG